MRRFLKKKEILILVAGILILVSLNLFQMRVRNFFYLISEPFQKNLFTIGKEISDFFEMIFKMRDLKKQNQILLIENQALKSQIAFLRELEKENEFLRKALNLGLQEDFKLVLAHLIGKDVLRDSILIDKGSRDGISKGQPVITEQRILLGQITEVFENFSKVMLITDKESSFPVRVQESNVTGVLKGGGNLSLFLDLVPQEAEIKKGQWIVTISLDGTFPKGLLIGEIEIVQKSDIAPYQKAKVNPAFDLKNLENLFVIMNY